MTEDERDDFPVADHAWGLPVPDLRRIPQDRWLEVLRPLPRRVRMKASHTAPTRAVSDVLILIGGLDLEDAEREHAAREAARRSPDVPAPSVEPVRSAERRWGRQISMRISDEQFEKLQRAASHLGLTHTQCARMFVLNGSARVVYELDRAAL